MEQVLLVVQVGDLYTQMEGQQQQEGLLDIGVGVVGLLMLEVEHCALGELLNEGVVHSSSVPLGVDHPLVDHS